MEDNNNSQKGGVDGGSGSGHGGGGSGHGGSQGPTNNGLLTSQSFSLNRNKKQVQKRGWVVIGDVVSPLIFTAHAFNTLFFHIHSRHTTFPSFIILSLHPHLHLYKYI